ncbi:unnamed protein product [Blepharisma stoltei]|uniref:Uncharacterized protein n=1 Tax=Blepharisma stoltei TaxID=1481888 RepID=A0AAU9J0R9_9CILI|nr:unnamed protein product [Blepharisma stoltei]
MRRCFSFLANAPWVFKNSSAPSILREMDPKFKQVVEENLTEGFTFAFRSICEALSNHDKSILSECLEGRLFETVSSRIDALENSGHQFKLLDTENFDLKEYNLCISMGVEIERKNNKPKEDYVKIASLEEIKPMASLGSIKEEIGKAGLPWSDDLWKNNMDYIWVYISPSAPANIIFSIDAVFYGQNPLTLIHNSKDVVYNDNRENEIHVLKFESCAINKGLQKNILFTGGFQGLIEPLKRLGSELLKQSWVVVDIDNIMGGNPYVISKNSKKLS